MTTLELIKKYPNVDPNILKQYKPAEKFIIFNDDNDLHKIKVNLPEPPEYHKIVGFGLPPHEQKWNPPKLPPKLVALQKKCEMIDEIYTELERNQRYYKEEIKFIKKQWYYMLNGYWIFINGVPTYIDGWHWFYMAWWRIDIGLPRYRSRDRKFFIFARFCYTDTVALYRYRVLQGGKLQYFATKEIAATFCKQFEIKYDRIEEGLFFYDFKRRICYGFIYPKHRREGATYKGGVINYCVTIVHKNAEGGIQSMTDDDAKKVFRKAIISPWKKLPFFFKPNYEGSTDPKEELSFNPPAVRLSSKGSKAVSSIGLESKIDFAIADGSGYDGQKKYFHHHDEVAKLKHPLDIVEINNVTRECLSENMGMDIIGLGIKTSTVGKMDEKTGGPRFRDLCDMSKYEVRDDNGQTLSGFYICFIPAEDGIVVDEFGNSIIEDPKVKTYDIRGNIIKLGGRSIIQNKRKALIADGKFEELAREKRKFPNKFRECFSTAGKESGLPIGKIEYRLEELAFNNPNKIRGNFYWVNGFGSRVEFEPDELGKWYLSKRLLAGDSNRKFWDSNLQSWVPLNKSKFILGIDPFKYNISEDSRRSKGGGAVFYKHDLSVDPSLDYKEWKESNRFVCTYSHRTFDKEEFFEDMLMTAIYFSAGVFPEINIPDILDYFDKKGYAEYMIYKFDPIKLKESVQPGAAFGNNQYKEEMFTEYATYLTRHCHREVHDEILNDCKQIDGPKETHRFDRFTAGGWALIGAKQYIEEIKEPDSKETQPQFFKQYQY